jgi:phosphoribosylanthranilate isomerase
MTKIKICGIKDLDGISYVNQYKPDYIGFVFANSKRQVHDEEAVMLKNALDKSIQVVGVFVNEQVEHIISLCERNIIDIVQLHGDEDEIYVKKLRKSLSNTIIKAVRVQSSEQIQAMGEFNCDYLLLDTFVKGSYGGSGIGFDRKLIPSFCKTFFLAGGLNKDNILQAIKDCNPFCVDLSSGVETNHKKDEQKIKEIIELVRSLK